MNSASVRDALILLQYGICYLFPRYVFLLDSASARDPFILLWYGNFEFCFGSGFIGYVAVLGSLILFWDGMSRWYNEPWSYEISSGSFPCAMVLAWQLNINGLQHIMGTG